MYSNAKAKGKEKEGPAGSNASTPRTDVETPRHNIRMYSNAKAKGKEKEGPAGSNASTPRTDVETPRHNVGMYSAAKAKGKAKAKMRNTQVKDVSKQESGKDSPKND